MLTTAIKLRRALLAGIALAAGVAPPASANHLPGFGHIQSSSADEWTAYDCNATVRCLSVRNLNSGQNAAAIEAQKDVGQAPAIIGRSNSTTAAAIGIHGEVFPGDVGGGSAGVRGRNWSLGPAGYGVYGLHDGSGRGGYFVSERGTALEAYGAYGDPTGLAYGVHGLTGSTAMNAAGVLGEATANIAGTAGVYGRHGNVGALGIGVRGQHNGAGNGVYGSVALSSVGAAGVLGHVLGTGAGGVGVYGAHNGSGYGVYGNAFGAGGAGIVGQAPNGPGWAGYFVGNVHVTGALSEGGGAFKIDHPLDPANKYLSHSFVESPEMKNVYDGVVRTDRRGFATVRLPSYFQALNRDFRYQLTILGRAPWRTEARVWDKIRANRFTIRTSRPRVEVSWQVTGVRKDRWANANRIEVEQVKPASERGKYLNPELYGAAKSKSVLRTPPAPEPSAVTRG